MVDNDKKQGSWVENIQVLKHLILPYHQLPFYIVINCFTGFPSSTTGSNLFGNQQNANTGLFGSSGTSAFGGTNKPAFGGFGSSTGTGLFGQQQQTQAVQPTPSLFGQSAGTATTGMFGSGG